MKTNHYTLQNYNSNLVYNIKHCIIFIYQHFHIIIILTKFLEESHLIISFCNCVKYLSNIINIF